MPFTLTSQAFTNDAPIPVRHTCDGDDLPPPLAWTDPPEGTAAFALVVDDPDAPSGTFTHFSIWDLPGDVRELPEGAGHGATEGTNDFSRSGYGGPCPPRGHGPHRYRFQLHALASRLELAAGSGRDEVDAALGRARVLGTALLTGRYERR